MIALKELWMGCKRAEKVGGAESQQNI